MDKEPAVIIGAITGVLVIAISLAVALVGLGTGAATALLGAVGSLGAILSSVFIRSKVTPA